MKHRAFLFFLLLVAGAAMAQRRPNIILFLVDDMGWMDTSVPFGDSSMPLNKKYHTPNMERLAQAGVKFTAAYATPVCTPTRISLITGMNAARHGVTNWTSPWKDRNTDNEDEQLAPAHWNINGLSNAAGTPRAVHATTFPQLLKDAGYFTIHVGKAHWGPMGTPGASPYNLGFMVNIAGHAAGHPQSYLGRENYGNIVGKASVQAVPDLQEYHGTDTFLTETLTLEAIKALEAPVKMGQPFYLSMSHYAVHDPIQGDVRFLKKYEDAGMEGPEARYASLLEGMDKSLGDLMDFLQQRKLEKNTVILFMSDNGGLSYTPPRGGQPHTHNLPLRAGKGSVYEGGIRVPMIVSWPGTIRSGEVAAQYVMAEDLFPTVLQVAGIKKYRTVQQTDGHNLLPLLKNPALQDTARTLVWHLPNKWQPKDAPGINYKSAIRQGAWKLVYNMRDGSKELYNLNEDLGEQHNLATKFPEKVAALSQLLGVQLQQWRAPMPVIKSTGAAVPLPSAVK